MIIIYNFKALGCLAVGVVVGLVVHLVVGDWGHLAMLFGSIAAAATDIVMRLRSGNLLPTNAAPSPAPGTSPIPNSGGPFDTSTASQLPGQPPVAPAPTMQVAPSPELWKLLLGPNHGGHVFFLPAWLWSIGGLLFLFVK